jgi:bifunctional non-homologous end joining protein LigD
LARRDANGVRLFTRNGYNFADRFPMIVAALKNLPARSCFIDGEAIVVDRNGLSVFDLLRYRQHDHAAVLCAFDLIELDGEDLRRSPFEHRKRALAELLRQKTDGIILNVHYEGDGAAIYRAACTLGCEGIVSKRLGSPYRAGRSDHWIKVKNPAAPAVRREAEEEWGGRRTRRTSRIT